VTIKVFREGKELTFPVTISEMPGEEEEQRRASETESTKGVGLTVQDITPELARRLEIANARGVLVTTVEGGSNAEAAGFQEGDIIRQINGQPVPNVAEFTKLVNRNKGGKPVRFLVERGEIRLILALTLK
jgi:S1-C subfamily serine protease